MPETNDVSGSRAGDGGGPGAGEALFGLPPLGVALPPVPVGGVPSIHAAVVRLGGGVAALSLAPSTGFLFRPFWVVGDAGAVVATAGGLACACARRRLQQQPSSSPRLAAFF